MHSLWSMFDVVCCVEHDKVSEKQNIHRHRLRDVTVIPSSAGRRHVIKAANPNLGNTYYNLCSTWEQDSALLVA